MANIATVKLGDLTQEKVQRWVNSLAKDTLSMLCNPAIAPRAYKNSLGTIPAHSQWTLTQQYLTPCVKTLRTGWNS